MTTSVTLVRLFDRSWEAWLRGVQSCRQKPTRRAVHALRVDCRRLEALVDVLGYTTEAPAKTLRRLGKVALEPLDALSSLRDDQVQRRRIAGDAGNRGMHALLDAVRRREARHKARARTALAGIDVARADAVAHRVRAAVVGRQGTPTPHDRTLLLLAAVDAGATEVRRRLARMDPDRPRSLHRLRVAIKRLRYVVEIAGDVSPGVRVSAQPTLRSLQRRLGAIHDADVLAARVGRFARRRRKHLRDVRAFKTRIESDRSRDVRALSRELPALDHATLHHTAR